VSGECWQFEQFLDGVLHCSGGDVLPHMGDELGDQPCVCKCAVPFAGM
jgi:hypothetical protein